MILKYQIERKISNQLSNKYSRIWMNIRRMKEKNKWMNKMNEPWTAVWNVSLSVFKCGICLVWLLERWLSGLAVGMDFRIQVDVWCLSSSWEIFSWRASQIHLHSVHPCQRSMAHYVGCKGNGLVCQDRLRRFVCCSTQAGHWWTHRSHFSTRYTRNDRLLSTKVLTDWSKLRQIIKFLNWLKFDLLIECCWWRCVVDESDGSPPLIGDA